MDMTVVSFRSTTIVPVGWVSKNYLPFNSFSKLILFFVNILGFLSLKCSKTLSHATLYNTFASAIWNVLQENKFMLPARFEQATISLVVIDNSKVIHPTICSGEECGLISWTAVAIEPKKQFPFDFDIVQTHTNCWLCFMLPSSESKKWNIPLG